MGRPEARPAAVRPSEARKRGIQGFVHDAMGGGAHNQGVQGVPTARTPLRSRLAPNRASRYNFAVGLPSYSLRSTRNGQTEPYEMDGG